MSAFNAAQNETLKRAYDMLGEQFDNLLIVVSSETDSGGERKETTRLYWSGGFVAAVGLSTLATRDLLKNEGIDTLEPQE